MQTQTPPQPGTQAGGNSPLEVQSIQVSTEFSFLFVLLDVSISNISKEPPGMENQEPRKDFLCLGPQSVLGQYFRRLPIRIILGNSEFNLRILYPMKQTFRE